MPEVEQSVSGRTRGEYYRPLNLDALSVPEEGWIFVCPTVQNYTIMLKPSRKYVVNGEVIKERGVAARFRDYKFTTRKELVADLLRDSRAFRLGIIKELGDAKAAKTATKKKRLAKLLEDDPELAAAAKEVLGVGKGKTPTASKKEKEATS